jgi:hypothetical protein
MKYTVIDVTEENLLVRFDDGSHALVPLDNTWNKERIEEEISKFIPGIGIKTTPFSDVGDVPFNVGDSNDIKRWSQLDQERIDNERNDYLNSKKSYDLVRKQCYPTIGDQLDSLYHAGLFPQEMADKIKKVKDDFPKDMEPILTKEMEVLSYGVHSFIYADGEPLGVPNNAE